MSLGGRVPKTHGAFRMRQYYASENKPVSSTTASTTFENSFGNSVPRRRGIVDRIPLHMHSSRKIKRSERDLSTGYASRRLLARVKK